MQVSIVTAVYNRLDLTREFWRSLEQHPPPEPWEIIWVDDGSTDGTREWLQSLPAPRHRVILNEANLGYAAANNRAAAAATGEILALLNNDLVLTPGWFGPMAAALNADSLTGVVGNIQLQPATGRIDHAGLIFDLAGLPDHHLKNRRPGAARGPGGFFHAASAACWLVRKPTFLTAGGFNERYRNGCEDVDLCLRLGARGFRHWVDYRSVVWHHVSSSPGRKSGENANLRAFLQTWGQRTTAWGEQDWPRSYLSRHLWSPARLNGPKTCDALLRLLRLRHGSSAWAEHRRQQLLQG